MTIFAPAARRGLFVDWTFFDGSEISSEFVGGQCASRRLPPKAAVSAYGRHSFVEGIRNGGLDFVKAAVSVFRAWRLPTERRLFFFCRRPAGLTNHCSFCLIQEVEQMKNIELQLAHQYSTMVYI